MKNTNKIRQMILITLFLTVFSFMTLAAPASGSSSHSKFSQESFADGRDIPLIWKLDVRSKLSVQSNSSKKTSSADLKEREELPVTMSNFQEILNSSQIQVPLPSGEVMVAHRDYENAAADNWSGYLYNDFDTYENNAEVSSGSIVISFDGSAVSGAIFTRSSVFEISGSDNNITLSAYQPGNNAKCLSDNSSDSGEDIWKIDNLSTQQQAANYSPTPKTAFFRKTTQDKTAEISGPTDSGDRVDVMIVYTAAVAAGFGGSASQIQAFAESAIATTNSVFSNSENITRVNLVGTMQTTRTESGSLGTDLNFAKSDPSINSRRNELQADLVVMLVENGNACGTAALLTKAGPISGSGFSVVRRNCAVGGLAFAHEIGHNFGSDHDPSDLSVPSSALVSPAAFGHFVNGEFITIMAVFSNENCPVYCPRILNFSNPAVFRRGIPTGISGQRDNASVIDMSADVVANLRVSSKTVTLIYPDSRVGWRRNLPRTVRWNSSGILGDIRIEFSRDGGRSFETLIDSTANDGEETIVIKGRSTKYGRIRIVSADSRFTTDTSKVNISVL